MIRFFVLHRTAANLLMFSIILLGIAGARTMTRAVFPVFASEFVHIKVIYEGASAEVIEDTICQRIEDHIEGIEGIEEVRSSAREGMGLVAVKVADASNAADLLADLESAVDQIDSFPTEAEDPIVWVAEDRGSVVSLSLTGEIGDKDLLALAETIRDELIALEGVSAVEVMGFGDRVIRVEVEEEALRAYGLSVADVAREIASQSVEIPLGSIQTGRREIKIRMVDQSRRAEDFRNLSVVSSAGGARILLGTVAKVTDTFDNDWNRCTFNGQPCVTLRATKTDQEDIIDIADVIRDYAAQRAQSLPTSVKLVVWGDWSAPVRDRLGMLIENGAMGFVLVFAVLWLFLNFRLAVWVALGIPVSFLGTLWLLNQAGLTLNMITMFSLILALGLIVDDAIVLGENIYAHRIRGKRAIAAAIDGTKEVALGVISSMLTTVAIFMPLMLMHGEIGKILRVLPFGVIAALLISLIECFFILPHHLGRSLRTLDQPNRVRATIDGLVNRFVDGVYEPVLTWCLNHRLIPIAGFIAMLLVSVGLLVGGRLGFQPFPKLDGDVLVARILLPRGTNFERTTQVVRRVESALAIVNQRFRDRQPLQQDLVRHYHTTYGVNSEVGETGSHVATIAVELLAADTRDARCEEVLQVWREQVGEIPDVLSLVYDQLQVTPGAAEIDVRLRGKHLDDLKAAALELRQLLRRYPGVRNLTDDLQPGKQEVRLRLKPVARSLGVSARDLARQLRGALWGETAQEFSRGPDTLAVEVRFRPSDRRSLADLEDFKVLTTSGALVPFHEVATAEMGHGYARIIRVNGWRTVSVTCDVDIRTGNAARILADLQAKHLNGLLKRHPGVSLSLEGQRKETVKTSRSIQYGFLVGLAMMFILLSCVFQSYVQPIIVMSAIPFGLTGAILGHLLMGIDWTIPSTLGFVSLAGIVVNDSIVLVQFIKLRLREGVSAQQAVVDAGRARFRAVFLTSATTVGGLLPILFETSLQAQFLIPMAVSVAFGLMFSTVLVLILVPCLFSSTFALFDLISPLRRRLGLG